jgi:hypothetical protein
MECETVKTIRTSAAWYRSLYFPYRIQAVFDNLIKMQLFSCPPAFAGHGFILQLLCLESRIKLYPRDRTVETT